MICPYAHNNMTCPFNTYSKYSHYRQASSVTITSYPMTKEDNKIKEYLQVPVFHGSYNPRVMEFINGNIRNDILEFKNQLEQEADEHYDMLKKQGKRPDPYEISNAFSVTYNKNNILSVSLFYHENIGKRNSYIRTSYNYNLATGESMPLRSLFKPNTDYLRILNRKIAEKLSSTYPGMIPQFKGIEEDQPYYIDKDTLVIFPNFNQIGTTVSDIPVVRIPFSELSNIIRPQLLT